MARFILSIVLFVATCSAQFGFGQSPVVTSSPPVRRTADGRILVGTDPANRTALFKLMADDRQVQDALELVPNQIDAAREILQKGNAERIRLIRSVPKQASEDVKAAFKEALNLQKMEMEDAIEEILLPEQMRRLRQLVYWIEVAEIGLPEALVEGRLGEAAGIYGNQKHSIAETGHQILAELDAKIAELRRETEAKILAELAPEQRKSIEELLGPEFRYKTLSFGQQVHDELKRRREEERAIQE